MREHVGGPHAFEDVVIDDHDEGVVWGLGH
jgi:hypothetical protein